MQAKVPDWRQRAASTGSKRRGESLTRRKPTRVIQLDLVDDSGGDLWRPLKNIGPLEDALERLSVFIRWHDQGWGEQKSRLRAVLRRGGRSLAKIDLFGVAPHEVEEQTAEIEGDDFGGVKAEPGDVIVLDYVVGKGGGALTGHELHIEKLKLSYWLVDPQEQQSASQAAAPATTAELHHTQPPAAAWRPSSNTDTMAVRTFLENCGLENYAAKFIMLGFESMSAVANMTEAEMSDCLGMSMMHTLVLKVALSEQRAKGVDFGGSAANEALPAAVAPPASIFATHPAPAPSGGADAAAGASLGDPGGAARAAATAQEGGVPEAPSSSTTASMDEWVAMDQWVAGQLGGERKKLFSLTQTAMEGQVSVPDPTLLQLAMTAEEAVWACAQVKAKCVEGLDADTVAAYCAEAEEAVQRASWAASAAYAREVKGNDSFAVHSGFIPIGGDIHVDKMTVENAQELCTKLRGCRGFTFKGDPSDGIVQVYFKDKWELNQGSTSWTSVRFSAASEATEWAATVKQIAMQAAEAAAQMCQEMKSNTRCMPSFHSLARDRAASKVPCKFHQQGRCANGVNCQFSHDANVTRPVYMKMDKLCIYHERGQCARGAECPFAHGEEERWQIAESRSRRGHKRPREDGGGSEYYEQLSRLAPVPLAEQPPHDGGHGGQDGCGPYGGCEGYDDRRQTMPPKSRYKGPRSLPQATLRY